MRRPFTPGPVGKMKLAFNNGPGKNQAERLTRVSEGGHQVYDNAGGYYYFITAGGTPPQRAIPLNQALLELPTLLTRACEMVNMLDALDDDATSSPVFGLFKESVYRALYGPDALEEEERAAAEIAAESDEDGEDEDETCEDCGDNPCSC